MSEVSPLENQTEINDLMDPAPCRWLVGTDSQAVVELVVDLGVSYDPLNTYVSYPCGTI